MPLPKEIRFTVSFPVEDGFLGRECNAPECGRFFKVHKDHISSQMHCPYCGTSFPNDQLWTNDQLGYARGAVAHEVLPKIADEFRRMMRDAFKGPHWTFKSGGPTPRPPMPVPTTERAVDSELHCPDCAVRFQVDGIFGYCPGCRSENLRLYDANLEIIRREVARGATPERTLRHAYADLVSTFEIFCRKEAAATPIAPARFQNLAAARQAFLNGLGVDILAGLSATDNLALRRVFQKRHVWEHNDGVIDQRYVSEVPEDAALLGQKAPLSLDELELAAHAVRRVLEALVAVR